MLSLFLFKFKFHFGSEPSLFVTEKLVCLSGKRRHYVSLYTVCITNCKQNLLSSSDQAFKNSLMIPKTENTKYIDDEFLLIS